MEAAPVEIVRITDTKPAPKPGVKSTEFWVTVGTNALGLLGRRFLPAPWRWIPVAAAGLVNVAYVISRGLAKK